MIKVVFVGDSPSSLNLSKDIPFVGAKCFERLVSWIKVINPDYYILINSELNYDLCQIKLLFYNDFKIIALGKNASNKLTTQGINHFSLPHPSGLNRNLNDNNYVSSILSKAYNYVRSASPETFLLENYK
jgi:uracil-DNA glycosylase